MKHRIFVVAFLLLFSIFIHAGTEKAEEVREVWGVKKFIDTQDVITPLALQRDRPRVVLLVCYLTDSTGDLAHVAKLSNMDQLRFYIEYTALFNTKVRFHFIWTGPEYRTYTTSWYSATVNTYSWVYVYYTNPTSWKKGTYSLVVVAEQKILGGGDDCVMTSVFKLY